MVVDALGDSRERLATPLKRDYKVLRAASGEAALALMEREEIDLLISDVQLPGVTGLELLQIVRANYPLAESILVADGLGSRRRGAGDQAWRLSLSRKRYRP